MTNFRFLKLQKRRFLMISLHFYQKRRFFKNLRFCSVFCFFLRFFKNAKRATTVIRPTKTTAANTERQTADGSLFIAWCSVFIEICIIIGDIMKILVISTPECETTHNIAIKSSYHKFSKRCDAYSRLQ